MQLKMMDVNLTELLNVTSATSLQNVTQQEHFANIATAAYVSILMTIGTVGNSIVLYIYGLRFKPNTFNTFIIFLAIFDFVCCTIEMPLDVANITNPTLFNGCKPIVIIATTTALATGFILVFIAVLRYRGICNPLKPNISVKHARIMCFVSLCCAMAISWPSAVIVNDRLDELEEQFVVVTCASEHQFKDTLYPLIFNGILFLIFFVAFSVIVILYSLIGRSLWLRKKYGPTHTPSCPSSSTTRTSTSSVMSDKSSKTKRISSQEGTASSVKLGDKLDDTGQEHQINNRMLPPTEASGDSLSSGKQNTTNQQNIQITKDNKGSPKVVWKYKMAIGEKETPKKSKSQNTQKMLFIVSLTFLLSYLPHLTLMVYEAVGSDIDVNRVGESIVGIVIRSYLINSASNPIIYGCYSKKFRDEMSSVWNSIRKSVRDR